MSAFLSVRTTANGCTTLMPARTTSSSAFQLTAARPKQLSNPPQNPMTFLQTARPWPHSKRASLVTLPCWLLILSRTVRNCRSNSIHAVSPAWRSCLRERRSSMRCGKKAWTICGSSRWMDRRAVSSRTSLRKKLADMDIRRTGHDSRLDAATPIPTRSCCAIFPVENNEVAADSLGSVAGFQERIIECQREGLVSPERWRWRARNSLGVRAPGSLYGRALRCGFCGIVHRVCSSLEDKRWNIGCEVRRRYPGTIDPDRPRDTGKRLGPRFLPPAPGESCPRPSDGICGPPSCSDQSARAKPTACLC